MGVTAAKYAEEFRNVNSLGMWRLLLVRKKTVLRFLSLARFIALYSADHGIFYAP